MTRNISLISFLFVVTFASTSFAASFNPGDKLQLLSNLHPDVARQRLYTMNYQLADLIPTCAEVTVVKKNKKKFIFEWQSVEYTMLYDKHTKKRALHSMMLLASFLALNVIALRLRDLAKLTAKVFEKVFPMSA